MDISDITMLELSDDEFLCTFKSKTFIVKRTPVGVEDGWVISEEQRDGSLKALEGVHDTIEDAMAYFKELNVRTKKTKERVTKRKGGVALPKNWHWEIGERLIADINGRFYIGTISRIFGNVGYLSTGTMYVRFDAKITDDEGLLAWMFSTSDERIVGRGIDRENPKPIPAKNLHLWLTEKVIEKPEFEFVIDSRWKDASDFTDLTKVKREYLNYVKNIKQFFKVPLYYRMVEEYLRTHRVTFYNNINEMYLVEGLYWNAKNEVALNYKNILTSDLSSAVTVLHEVIHYKLWPVRTKLRNFLKKHVCTMLGLDKDDPAIAKWLKLFCEKRVSLKVGRVRSLLRDTAWEDYSFDILYGLVGFYEFPSVVLSHIVTGFPTCEEYEDAYDTLFNVFKNQIMK